MIYTLMGSPVLPFKLWVDADALPRILRDVIIRASDRYQLEVTFVANQPVGITPSIRINSIQVMSGRMLQIKKLFCA